MARTCVITCCGRCLSIDRVAAETPSHRHSFILSPIKRQSCMSFLQRCNLYIRLILASADVTMHRIRLVSCICWFEEQELQRQCVPPRNIRRTNATLSCGVFPCREMKDVTSKLVLKNTQHKCVPGNQPRSSPQDTPGMASAKAARNMSRCVSFLCSA